MFVRTTNNDLCGSQPQERTKNEKYSADVFTFRVNNDENYQSADDQTFLLMDDFDKLERLNTINKYEVKDKESKINSLSIENDFYKNNRRLNKLEKERHDHFKEISDKDRQISYYKDAFKKVTRALDIITKRRPMPYVHDYVSFAESVMAGVRLRQMDEEAQREFDEVNHKVGGDLWL